ncbi:MAG: YbaB/EbfC family nucleoid-associated protein [Clostridia bacterium]|nr:YbaB/EbfC family nucleoid-associated protein [Clostridia bacterium]
MAGFNGFGGGMQMQQLMKQAQAMQEKMQRQKEELEASVFTATSGGGMVELKMNGKRELVALKIKPEVVDPEDTEMLEDLIKAAVNDANSQIDAKMQEMMPGVPGGFF